MAEKFVDVREYVIETIRRNMREMFESERIEETVYDPSFAQSTRPSASQTEPDAT